MKKLIGWLILIGLMIWLFGTGLLSQKATYSPDCGKPYFVTEYHPFKLVGSEGGLTLFCALVFFIDVLFFIWAMWHTFLGNYQAKQLALITFIIGVILLIAVNFSSDSQSGIGSYHCNNVSYTSGSKDCDGIVTATPDQIGKHVKCPKCGYENRVEKFWW